MDIDWPEWVPEGLRLNTEDVDGAHHIAVSLASGHRRGASVHPSPSVYPVFDAATG